MPYRVLKDGTMECDTAQEAVDLQRLMLSGSLGVVNSSPATTNSNSSKKKADKESQEKKEPESDANIADYHKF